MRYRIRPETPECYYIDYWDTEKEIWESCLDWADEHWIQNPPKVRKSTSKEAEEFIDNQIKAHKEWEQKQDWKLSNPPYEYP